MLATELAIFTTRFRYVEFIQRELTGHAATYVEQTACVIYMNNRTSVHLPDGSLFSWFPRNHPLLEIK